MSDERAPLTPPESLLKAPEAVTPVQAQEAPEMVPLSPEDRARLDEMARAFAQDVLKAGAHTPEFKRKLTAVHELGMPEQRAAAQSSNRMLERPLRATRTGALAEGSDILRGLTDLRRTVEDLDPSRTPTPRRLFGMLPGAKKVQNHLDRYQSAQSHLNGILEALYRGQDELRRDNATIETEKVHLWDTMQKLRQYAHVGKAVDQALTERLAELQTTDPEKARMVSEELLFAVRQRVTDLLTQLAVSIQGYLALDLVRRNNLELIKGVDRATTTTVSALKTALMVSQALGTQQAVLRQVTALNDTTGKMIGSTASLLKHQSTEIQRQAGSATVDPQIIQAAFRDVYSALDSISAYRSQALDRFRETMQVLDREVSQAQTYLDRERQQASRELAQDLNVTAQGDLKI
ncbi:toxic anion resistance protein [Deinococcus deserti]|uniref:Putative toxic anion resistance protein n=1 Tax=Deinococcus deserti (strain DSM 17065 / CIP 109153 / LMG 22923 / VCD115) TaxID=546414 RepID=C1D0I9_DEIDV|nr:toxic anion resistance protein [Deinococcus deserti]ACO45363.1 putative toxic anion resistance protein [Deinococcus deserti VCD115]